MLFYALAGLINAITSTILGLFIYFKNRKEIINKSFALFCLSIAVWSYAYYFWQVSTDAVSALFWSRALMAGAIFIPFCYFHFVLAFLGKISEKKKFLIFGYFTAFLFLILNFTSLFVKEVGPALSFKFWPQPGIAFHPFFIIWMAYVVYCTYLLLVGYKQSTGIKQTQIKYLLIGITTGFVGGSTNYFLWYGIPIPPIGNILVVTYVIFTALAIVKYHLMEIRVVLAQLLVGVIAVLLLIQVLVSESFLEYAWKGALFITFLIFGYLLIKSVLNEIRQREELQKAYQELKKLDRAKSEFISIASHQLRTPLTAIKGYISMMREKIYGKPPEKMEKPLENIYLSNERLIKLVNDLLNVSRIEAGRMEMKLEKLSLEEIITSVVGELKNAAKEKDIYLKWEKLKKPLPKISVDRDKIRQAIMNMVDNAIRYTEHGGVTVNVKCQIPNVKTKGKIIIEVKDTGAGLTRYELSKMFESFSRGMAGTRLYTEGVGLGLYIARRFIEMHKGKVWGKSKGKGKGSQFFIELPIVKLPLIEFKKFLKEF